MRILGASSEFPLAAPLMTPVLGYISQVCSTGLKSLEERQMAKQLCDSDCHYGHPTGVQLFFFFG